MRGNARAAVVALVLLLLGSLTSATSPAARPAAAAAAESAKIRPLVIVLDLSSSMAEDDGSGTIKLAGAQAALANVIRQQRPGATLGLWTYPGTGGSCGAGSFEVPVGEVDQRSMVATIKELDVAGDTPTGPALREVADELTEQGYDGATLLLISDGESNCGSPPCRTAKQIVAEGFDLTVQAAGFQISGGGLRELECIASATGGQVYEASDSEQLGELVDAAARAVLTMELVGIPSSTPAGSASRVTVLVRNDSAVDVENVRVSLDFGAGGFDGAGVVPAALPPLKRLGNIPAGTGQRHTWVVGYGSRGKVGSAGWRVAAWGSNAQPVVREGTIEVTDEALGLGDAGGYIGGLADERIAILGDSYSSGEGAGSYLPGTDKKRGDPDEHTTCHRSMSTYLAPLFDEESVELLACSGATTRYRDGEVNGVQEDQVGRLADLQDAGDPFGAAFMTVGGNDIGFGSIVIQCLLARPTVLQTSLGPDPALLTNCAADTAWRDGIYDLVDHLGPDLRTTYLQVYDALNDTDAVDARGEVAPLYVLAYPQPFPEQQWVTFCRGFERDEIAFANDLVDRLNATIQRTVTDLYDAGYRIEMVTTTQETFLPDNTACPRPGSEEFMNSVAQLQALSSKAGDWVRGENGTAEFMHPNARGYQAETNTILQWATTATGELPEGLAAWRPGRRAGYLDLLVSPILARALTPTLPGSPTVRFEAASGELVAGDVDLRGGQPFTLEVRDAAPGSDVLVAMASRPRTIGTVQVDDEGAGSAQVTLPPQMPAGTHQLMVYGFDSEGAPVTAAIGVDVARALPFWLAPLVVATLLCFLGWGVCRTAVRRHERRRTTEAALAAA